MSDEISRPTRRPVRGAQGEPVPALNPATNPEQHPIIQAPANENIEEVVQVEPAHTDHPAEGISHPTIKVPQEPEDDGETTTAMKPLSETPLRGGKGIRSGVESRFKNKGEKSEKQASGLIPKARKYSPKRRSLIITTSVLGGIAVVLGFSLYRVAQAPTTDDIITVYQQQSGDYGFPVDKGQEAATRFLSLYLNIPNDPDVRNQNAALLDSMLINATTPTTSNNVVQRIVSGPTPAGLMNQVDAGTADQRYTAIIETTVIEPQEGTDIAGSPLNPQEKSSIHLVTYRVNMLVDSTGTTVLINGNPTLLPNTFITNEMKIVTPPLGSDGGFSNELTDSLVKPFFKVWAESDTAAINSWLATNAGGQWAAGLDGAQTMGNVTVSAPSTVKSSQQGDVTAQVEWISPNGNRQTSTYTLSIVYENSRWLVQNLT